MVPWQQIHLNNYEHNHGLERWIDDEGHSVRDEQCFYARSESRPDEDQPEANCGNVVSFGEGVFHVSGDRGLYGVS